MFLNFQNKRIIWSFSKVSQIVIKLTQCLVNIIKTFFTKKCTSTDPSTKKFVDIPLDLEIKQRIFKDKNNLKYKRIKEVQTMKDKYIHKLRRETYKEKQRIIQEVKMKHGKDKIQNDLGRINDMFKNQVSLLLSNSR